MNEISQDRLQHEICQFLGAMLDCEVTPTDNLKDKGLDSVAFLDLVIFVEKRLGISPPLELLIAEPVRTVEALTERLASIALQYKSVGE